VRATCPAHLILLDEIIVRSYEASFLQYSLAPQHFFLLRFKYSLQHPVLKNPQPGGRAGKILKRMKHRIILLKLGTHEAMWAQLGYQIPELSASEACFKFVLLAKN
jgi:hypothetical protein